MSEEKYYECPHCGQTVFEPDDFCDQCGANNVQWVEHIPPAPSGAKLTVEDARSLNHFWTEYQDLGKYSRYRDLNLRRDAPLVAQAWHDYLEAERRLSIELHNLEVTLENQDA